MTRSYCAQLFAGDRVTNQHWLFDLELSHHGQNVVREPLRSVASASVCRSPESAPRDGVDVVIPGELRSKIIPYMRGIPETGEEHERTSRATPVQHIELNTLVYGNHFAVV
jgi:hypothetical protein